ncbi:hypothetical protein CBM2585_A30054 [Cupriavidus taiwanensis]|nr:hypothetical protein CBM2585_A30054 [Cupriavidus taiwanensis]
MLPASRFKRPSGALARLSVKPVPLIAAARSGLEPAQPAPTLNLTACHPLDGQGARRRGPAHACAPPAESRGDRWKPPMTTSSSARVRPAVRWRGAWPTAATTPSRWSRPDTTTTMCWCAHPPGWPRCCRMRGRATTATRPCRSRA